MSTRRWKDITPLARVFLVPRNPTHRQYEALRAYFVDGRPSAEVAEDFGYTPGSFRVLCTQFRKDPDRQFFIEPQKGPKVGPAREPVRETAIELRKKNLSIYDISQILHEEGSPLSPSGVGKILQEEGFERLPRRKDEERPPDPRATKADVADVRALDLSPRSFETAFAGLYLFVPTLVAVPLAGRLKRAGFPGSKMIPADHAIRSLLALKLYGNARHSHVMSHVLDEGLALFAGLNVIPKRSFLTEYSCRVDPEAHPKLMRSWFDALSKEGLDRGTSLDLDFHTIPFHGEDALVEKHYVSKRSRRQKGVLAFLAQDARTRVFCYANADVRKEDQSDEILAFVKYWKRRTGADPEELIFDSKLTTYANLDKLNRQGISFMTLRRRSRRLMEEIRAMSPSAWRKITLAGVSRIYRTPKVIDQRIELDGYEGQLRQLIIDDLGHDNPTILITNQLRRSAPKLIQRYAERMLIENGIAEGIDFFHMDALSSAVAMKVNLDLQLTLMASSLYHLLAQRVGHGYQKARAQTIFRDLVQAQGQITIGEKEILVHLSKRAHNPLLIAAGCQGVAVKVPWLKGRTVRLQIG
jgi:hypothetical protein